MAKENPVTIRNSASVALFGHEEKAVFFSFHGLHDNKEHLAIGLGEWEKAEVPLVRLHSECMTGDVFSSAKCDCGNQLNEAMGNISQEGGFLLYLRQEGRGIGLYNKIDAYQLQNTGLDTFEANQKLGFNNDLRDFKVAAQMLLALGITKIRLISNNPIKTQQLKSNGIEIIELINTSVFCNPHNHDYLKAKIKVTNHSLSLP